MATNKWGVLINTRGLDIIDYIYVIKIIRDESPMHRLIDAKYAFLSGSVMIKTTEPKRIMAALELRNFPSERVSKLDKREMKVYEVQEI